MAIKFKAIQKTNPINKDQPKHYFPVAISSGRAELKDIAKSIVSRSTTVSDTDVLAVLNELVKEVKLRAENGETVVLGNLGYFHVTLSGKGSAAAKDVSASHIVETRLKFVPSKEIANTLRSSTFEKVA